MIKYKDANPIKPKKCTAWIIKLPDGSTLLELWSPDAEFEDVHYACSIAFERFVLKVVQVGSFELKEITNAYFSDGRGVNQDWEIVL